MSTIDEIKSKIDITDLVSEAGVQLRHAGKNYTGFCPFHDNKHTPAFVVWPESGTWRCWSVNEGGISLFIMKRENLESDALTAAGGRGIPIYKHTRAEAYDNLRKLLEDALIFFRGHLLANANLMGYLRSKRGLTDASIETFGLGYAPNAWDSALTHFTHRGYSRQDLLEAGLLSERESGGYFDRFRNRIMIPIRDENGKMSGFGARIVDPNDVPKFLNSPETPIFTKGHLLYGLDRARKPIRLADQAVIVEGYFDVIALHQAGYENVVSQWAQR
jgi:DNA primase